MSFEIKFTRQGFEKACLHHEACRAIQLAEPGKLDQFFIRFSVISDVIQKVQRHHDLIKAHA